MIKKHLRPERAVQYCPLCLKVAAYHRLIWLPIASAACLEHKCLLVNLCPGCGNSVRIRDIIETRCSSCKTNYTEAEPISIENDSFGFYSQSVIQNWLNAHASPISTIYSLPQQIPRNLFRIIDGIRFSLLHVNQDWPLLHNINIQRLSLSLPTDGLQILTAEQSYCLYATSCKGIINWPVGFHQFLTEYRKREKKSRFHNEAIYHGLSDELGTLYSQWINKRWKHAAMEFLQQAFYQLLADNHPSLASAICLTHYRNTPELADKLRYMSLNEAVKFLGTSDERLKLMIRSGRLLSYTEQGKSRIVLVKCEDVIELRNQWELAIDLKEVANWLGLTKKVVLQLVQIGLLAAQQSNAEGFYWMFSPADVTECLKRITERATYCSIVEDGNRENMLSLREASRLLQNNMGSGAIANTLQKVAEGNLRAYIQTDKKLQLGTLLFTRCDIDTYIETIKAEKGWINRHEVANILGINIKSVVSWMRAGLISPVIVEWQAHYFDRQAIEKLKTTLVLSAEASNILGVDRRDVRILIRQGRLKALRGPAIDGSLYYVFSRESLLEWKKARATLKEASQLFQVTEQKLLYWITQGKFPLPENEKQQPLFFSLQTLYMYREQRQKDSPNNIACAYQAH